MNKTIKTHEVVKDIKVLDKRRAGLAAVRDARAKVKDVAENRESPGQQYRDGNDYAQGKAEQTARDGTGVARKAATNGVRKTADSIRDVRSAIKNAKQGVQSVQSVNGAVQQQVTHIASKQTAQKTAAHTAAATSKAPAVTGKQAATSASGTTNVANTARGTIKQGAKGTVKTSANSIKTAGATAGKAVKTSQQTTRAAKATAKATQVAARSAAQTARAASKAAVAASKAAVKGIMAFVKMAVAAAKSLIAAIAAGGWVAVAVILIICLVGLIAASAFGIFFAGGDMGDGNPTLREVVAEVNQEHQDRVDEIKVASPHDELMLSGTRAPWREVLAVYSVRITTNTDGPLDAITLDKRRQELLREVYWGMNMLDYRVEDREYTEIVTVEQDDGTTVEETQVYTRRTLYITQSVKTADEMATTYSFDTRQRNLLAEMLTPQYTSAWQSVLYGIHSGSGDIVEVALSQLGNPRGAPYWSWYGFGSRVEWCACFVSWCANECGYIEAGVIPRFSWVPSGVQWFRDAGRFQERDYSPQPGDIIFFDWQGDGESDHVGIVEYVEGRYVHTIEGNSSDAVNRRTYSISSNAIEGYGFMPQ
ncbi:MAG: CHAP domain-containing protein [Coriobacteriales bacterium]|jgi:cell wall-associated NlpC family hydrolase|nr:CHAP domain-containing protein [Coriobacteriales bacterium]